MLALWILSNLKTQKLILQVLYQIARKLRRLDGQRPTDGLYMGFL